LRERGALASVAAFGGAPRELMSWELLSRYGDAFLERIPLGRFGGTEDLKGSDRVPALAGLGLRHRADDRGGRRPVGGLN
jgi:hypothetical protein